MTDWKNDPQLVKLELEGAARFAAATRSKAQAARLIGFLMAQPTPEDAHLDAIEAEGR